jgi:2-C-methyl-D-erythritol 4-phosphate cytidylyltransferase
MPAKGMKLIVSEYNILHEALKCYEERLDKLSSMTTDEDQEAMYDEKLQDIEGIIKALKISAKNDFNLEL